MSWLRKALVRLALSRPDATLVRESGGTPRVARGMTLDARMQFLEHNARKRARPRSQVTPEFLRAQAEAGAALFGGPKVSGVVVERVFITGRSHSTPARLYLPRVRDNRAPMLVYFHFGGGVIGSPNCCDRLCALIAKAAGAPVLSVQYRLAPEHKFPVGLEDAIAAYQWALANAARYGAPVGKAAVGGDSMGGGFAAIIAQEFARTKPPVLQLLIYPGVDFANDMQSMRDFADAWPLTLETVEYYMSHYLPEGADRTAPRLSPGRVADLSGLAPALIYTAGFDILLDQGAAYAERLRAAGVKTSYACFESLPHAFVAFPAAAPAAEAAIQRIAEETAVALKEAA